MPTLSKPIVLAGHSDLWSKRNALLATAAVGGLAVLTLSVWSRSMAKLKYGESAESMAKSIDVPKDPRKWSKQTVTDLVQAICGLLPKSGTSQENVMPGFLPQLLTIFLGKSVTPPLVSRDAPDDIDITPTSRTPEEVTPITSKQAENLVTQYANQYGHFELEKEMPKYLLEKIMEKFFNDMVALAAPDLKRREGIHNKAAKWSNKKCDVIPDRALHTQQVNKMKEDAKMRRAKQAMAKIRTERASSGDTLRIKPERTSSELSVSSVWSEMSTQSIVDGVRGLSSRWGGGVRDFLGIRL